MHGITTLGWYKAVGTYAPTPYVFTAREHQSIEQMMAYWKEFPCEIDPAIN